MAPSLDTGEGRPGGAPVLAIISIDFLGLSFTVVVATLRGLVECGDSYCTMFPAVGIARAGGAGVLFAPAAFDGCTSPP